MQNKFGRKSLDKQHNHLAQVADGIFEIDGGVTDPKYAHRGKPQHMHQTLCHGPGWLIDLRHKKFPQLDLKTCPEKTQRHT